MKTPLERIREGFTFLILMILIGTVGFVWIGNYSWLEALWTVVITISSVGYAERPTAPQGVQLWTIVVVMTGTVASIYTLGGFVQLLFAGEIDRVIGQRRMYRDIEQLKQHVVVCGFGRVGQVLVQDLADQKQPVVVVDKDPLVIDLARKEGYLCVEGDATEEETLKMAGLSRAKALFTGLPSDPDNVYITLTARNLCPQIQIIARAEHLTTEKKLKQAGANRVLLPAVVGAKKLGRMIMRPTVADLMDAVADSSFEELDVAEIELPPGSPLIGMTVDQTEAHRKHRVLFVAVKNAAGKMVFNPEASYAFQPHDVVLALGHPHDIQRMRTQHKI
ncbi:MAG: potassium channel protein [Pirellulales bacterium]